MSTLPGLPAVLGLNWRRLLRLIASAERGSEHRPGEATVRRAGELGLSLSQTSSLQAESERGIVAVVEERSPLTGNARMMDAHGTQPNSLGEQAFAIAVQGKKGVNSVSAVIQAKRAYLDYDPSVTNLQPVGSLPDEEDYPGAATSQGPVPDQRKRTFVQLTGK